MFTIFRKMRKKVEIVIETPRNQSCFIKRHTAKSIISIALEICPVVAQPLCFILALKSQKVGFWLL
jgi:hypothetical protein